eukprot:gnl/Chilomastix_caulleri/810.p1 GENE.gnl/Chilomastix_caulleri/810~~gnl/Chilomastix_caulleri/810.p1  ORF type:complete len:216 (+),score=52.75 gnl/Chilomastix_caulleri/810:62-649(+)
MSVELHPLQTAWALYCDKMAPKAGASNYQASLQKIAEAGTIEEFMTWFLHTKNPSKLENGVTLHVFRATKDDLKPMWESMPNGGTWALRIPQESALKGDGELKIDEIWDSVVLGLIGEEMSEPYIVGASCSTRDHEYIITLWYSGASDTEDEPPERTRNAAMKMLMPGRGLGANFRYVRNKDRKPHGHKSKQNKE